MTPSLHRIVTRHAGLRYLLILAFLSMALFPQHYHLQHAVDALPHAGDGHAHGVHAAKLHSHADNQDLIHHADGHIIDPATDISLKTPGVKVPWVVLLLAVLILLPRLVPATRQRLQSLTPRITRDTRHSTPPLRAPPRV